MRIRATIAALAIVVGGAVPGLSQDAVAAPAVPAVQPGTQPSVAGGPGSSWVHVAYTATDGSVDMVNARTGALTPLGGRVIGGPALIDTPQSILRPADALAVFARGTDNAVWWRHQTLTGWSRWASLGGQVSGRPSAATTTSGQLGQIAVFAAGPHGVIWMRNFVSGAWTGWHRLSRGLEDPMYIGPLRTDTGPSAAYDDRGDIFVSAVSEPGQAYFLDGRPAFGLVLFGLEGHTAWSPAVTATADQAVVFVRGVDNQLWFRSRPNPLQQDTHFGPWTTLGGQLTSAVTASTSGGITYVAALGTDNRIWMRSGTWPTLGPWQPVG